MGLFKRSDAAAKNDIRTLLERVQRSVAIINGTDEVATYFVAWNRMTMDLDRLLEYERAGEPFTPSIAETRERILAQKKAAELALIGRADAASRRAVEALASPKSKQSKRDSFFGEFAMYDNQMEPESVAWLARLRAQEETGE